MTVYLVIGVVGLLVLPVSLLAGDLLERAEAFAHYDDAAVLQMLIEVLSQIAREVAAPISNIKELTLDLEAVIKRAVDGAVPPAGHEPGAVATRS